MYYRQKFLFLFSCSVVSFCYVNVSVQTFEVPIKSRLHYDKIETPISLFQEIKFFPWTKREESEK